MLFGKAKSDSEATVDGDGLVYVSTRRLIGLRGQGESLALKASRINARQSGSYMSRFKGRGMEFDEARIYQPGDDVRTLDWRVTARTGIPHTKLFREERERAVLTWVDMRPSMFFATQGAFKSVIAAQAAALIGWSANKAGDRLGAMVFTNDGHHEIRPKRGKSATLQLLNLLSETSQGNPSEQSTDDEESGANALARLRRVAKPGSLIFLLSDFRNLGPQAESHLSQLSRHNDVVLCYIHDPLEEQLPDAGHYRVTWNGRDARFNSNDRKTRSAYAAHYQAHLQRIEQLGRFSGISTLSCSTDSDPLQVLKEGQRMGGR